MSKLFWAMLSFITRLPVPRRWSQGLDFEHYSRGIITPEAVSHSLALAASLDAQGYSVSDIIHILMAEGSQA